jgi:hypothetical protein
MNNMRCIGGFEVKKDTQRTQINAPQTNLGYGLPNEEASPIRLVTLDALPTSYIKSVYGMPELQNSNMRLLRN